MRTQTEPLGTAQLPAGQWPGSERQHREHPSFKQQPTADQPPTGQQLPFRRLSRRVGPLLLTVLALCVSACSSRQEQAAGGLMDRSQEDPALSGDGRLLAVISPQRGRPTVQLRSLSDGRLLPLPSLKRHQPHSSPSLSWNGRYLALVTQRGRRRLAVVADRLNNRLHPLPLPGGRDPFAPGWDQNIEVATSPVRL